MIHPDGSISVRCKVDFTRAPRGRIVAAPADAPKPPPKPRVGPRPVIDPCSVPKLTRSLVLGHHLERLVRDGVVRDYTQLARLVGLSKGRITQLVNLTLLAPEIQKEILWLDTSDVHSQRPFERNIRHVTALVDWNKQRATFKRSRR